MMLAYVQCIISPGQFTQTPYIQGTNSAFKYHKTHSPPCLVVGTMSCSEIILLSDFYCNQVPLWIGHNKEDRTLVSHVHFLDHCRPVPPTGSAPPISCGARCRQGCLFSDQSTASHAAWGCCHCDRAPAIQYPSLIIINLLLLYNNTYTDNM